MKIRSLALPIVMFVVTVGTAVQASQYTVARGEVTTQAVTYHSAALDMETTYIVVMPASLDPAREYPVLYLLHGATGAYSNWTEKTSVTQFMRGRDMILVTPDGGQYGWYLDSPINKKNRYDTAISRDLIADVESRFPVRKDRDGRGIAGLSMGGHGAITLAAKHPDLYSSASSMSGILNIGARVGRWSLNDVLPFDQPEVWKEHGAVSLVDNFAGADVDILVDTGVADKTGAVEDSRRFHEAMSNRGIAHEYREFEGTHNWAYWQAHVGEHLDFHQSSFLRRSVGVQPTPIERLGLYHAYTTRTLGYEKQVEQWKAEGKPADEGPSIVLLGSSTFEGIKPDLFPGYHVVNRGIGGDGLGIRGDRGLLHRLYCSVFDVQPDAILINNGTNDLYHTSKEGAPTVEEAGAGLDLLVTRIRETLTTTPIVVISCHSTVGERSGHIAPYIKPYNELTKQVLAKHEHVYYVDTWTATADAEGRLDERFSRDGLHLNAEGNALLARMAMEALREAGVPPKLE